MTTMHAMTPVSIHREPLRHHDSLRMLIVDDAPSTRRLLRVILTSVPSFELVGEVGTGAEAVTALEELRPDVVLLDLMLPDMDGLAVLSEIVRLAPSTRVVILSNAAKRAAPLMVSAGAIGFIEKGLPAFDLIERLSDLLGIRPQQLGEPVIDFLGSTPASARSAVSFDSKPTTRRQFRLVLADCGFQIISEVVGATEVAASLGAVVYMTRPALVILGEGEPIGDLISCVNNASPRTTIVVYASEPPVTSLHAAGVRVVMRPNFKLLKQTVRELATTLAPR